MAADEENGIVCLLTSGCGGRQKRVNLVCAYEVKPKAAGELVHSANLGIVISLLMMCNESVDERC
jgi:hypothetical protein